jgi:hypothetical protein
MAGFHTTGRFVVCLSRPDVMPLHYGAGAMYKPFDQFHKALLAGLLDGLGRVDAEIEVPSQIQYVDAAFEPDEPMPQSAALGWLGRMAAAGACLFECFSEPPSVEDMHACVRKQLVVHQERQLAARREGQNRRPPVPRLWVLSAGRPEAVLHAYEARPMPDWPPGFWHMRPAEPVHLVVVRELPQEPETLLLRLFGRGPTLAQALRELETLAPDTPEQRVVLPVVVAFRRAISHNDLEEHDMNAFQQLMAVYADIIHEAQEKGVEQGIRKGRKEGRKEGQKEGLMKGERAVLVRLLTRRFGPLPREGLARIRRADLATLERWTDRVLTARTLAEVLD